MSFERGTATFLCIHFDKNSVGEVPAAQLFVGDVFDFFPLASFFFKTADCSFRLILPFFEKTVEIAATAATAATTLLQQFIKKKKKRTHNKNSFEIPLRVAIQVLGTLRYTVHERDLYFKSNLYCPDPFNQRDICTEMSKRQA